MSGFIANQALTKIFGSDSLDADMVEKSKGMGEMTFFLSWTLFKIFLHWLQTKEGYNSSLGSKFGSEELPDFGYQLSALLYVVQVLLFLKHTRQISFLCETSLSCQK